MRRHLLPAFAVGVLTFSTACSGFIPGGPSHTSCGASGEQCCATEAMCDSGLSCLDETCIAGECISDLDCGYPFYNSTSAWACCNYNCYIVGPCEALDTATCTVEPWGNGRSCSYWTDMGPYGICCAGSCLEVNTCP